MKKIIFLGIVLFTFTLSGIHAQQDKSAFLQAKVQKFSKMKNTGVILLSAGGVSIVGGIVMMSNADWTKTSDGSGDVNYTSKDPKALIGILLTGAGVGLMGAGIPLTIIGNKKSTLYKKQLNELTILPYYDSHHAGIYLSFRF